MSFKCKTCGENCRDDGRGRFVCDCCGSMFSAEDFVSKRQEAPVMQEKGEKERESKEKDLGADIFEKNVKGVCEISTSTGRGSGYLIDAGGGYVITNSHVVSMQNGKSCGNCKVKVADQTVAAQVVRMGTEKNEEHCSNRDLALVQLSEVPFGAVAVTFGNSEKVRTGERIFVIGNSMGYGTCITSGIISDNNRHGQLMYDCATNPGNSGGPVFDADGMIIGTHVAGLNAAKVQGMNFAIPEKAVMEFLNSCGRTINIKKGK